MHGNSSVNVVPIAGWLVDEDSPAVAAHDALHGGEPESAPGGLGGEEGSKMRASVSASMPAPSSRTSSQT